MEGGNEENVSVEVIHDYIKNREEEIVLQKQQLDLAKQQDKNAYDYACKALELQAKDREDERKANGSVFNKILIAIGVILILFLIFCWMLMYYNQPQLLYEILKAVGVAIPTGFGGFYWGKQTEAKKRKDDLQN